MSSDQENNGRDLVESIIDQMVESDGQVDVASAVSSVLDGDEAPEFVRFDLSEDADPPACAICGNPKMVAGVLEDEDGGEVPAFHCESCDTGYVADDGVYEAEIDEEEPVCPACGSDELSGEVVEDEDGEEVPLITCESCGVEMVPVGDREEEGD